MISIILRAKNEMPWIKYTLRMLKLQTRQDVQLICVDSGSTDGSWKFLQSCKPDVLYQIEAKDYIPGKVLNQAISHAKGDFIVFNNADCIPKNKNWLQNLIQPLENDPELGAVYANQIHRPNAIPLVQKDYQRAFGDGEIAATWKHFFSLASSAIRREVIIQHPFKEDIQYSEDIEWSWRMKQLGYKIMYVPDAIVEHSHNYTLPQIKKRYLGEGTAEAEIYRSYYRDHPEELSFMRTVVLASGAESIRDWKYLIKHKYYQWIPLAPVYRLAQRYFAYKGRL
ncbi:MAG: glycosyltransferase, partial [Candidatus Cloacimonetes bacterium]|nr:glycosyltransferase [Candidatus Cloacimonadota bacterium]